MIYHVRNKARPKDTSIFFFYINVFYILALLFLSHVFNTLIMSEECNLRVNLRHATLIGELLEIVSDGGRIGSVRAGSDGGCVRSCAGVDGRKVRCGCIRYQGC